MRGIAIILLVVIFFALIWPSIAKWLKRKAMERAEDYIRSSMGLPPREKKRGKKNSGQNNQRQEGYYYRSSGSERRYGDKKEPLIPKEYAEDVEFTETIDYSSTTETRIENGNKIKYHHESQISDVEWVEIKKSGSK